jgi:hypothetical protein
MARASSKSVIPKAFRLILGARSTRTRCVYDQASHELRRCLNSNKPEAFPISGSETYMTVTECGRGTRVEMVHLRLNERETNPNPHINFISVLDAEEDARQLIRALAAQMKPVMRDHGFTVNTLEEVSK